jgi:signal transduction histidine kinase
VDRPAYGRLRRLRLLAAGIAIVVGALALLGLWANLGPLVRLAPGLPAIHPLSAIFLIIAGVSLAMEGHLAQALALVQLLVGVAILAAHSLALRGVRAAPGEWLPMPGMAVMMLLAGAALLLRESRSPRLTWAAQIAALLAIVNGLRALLGLVPIIGYEALIVGNISGLSLHGAGAWLMIGVGILASRPDGGFMPLALSAEPAGRLLRWLALTGTVLPLLMVLLTDLAGRAGLFGTWPGLLLLVVGNLLIFYVTAASYGRADRGRREAEAGLSELNADLERRVAERTAALERDKRYQAALFACSQALLPTADTPAARGAALAEALGHLLAATGASRVVLIRNVGDEERGIYGEPLARAYAPGFESSEELEILWRRPWHTVNFDLRDTMQQGLPIYGSLDELSARFPAFRPMLEAMGVRSMLTLSLRVAESWWGALSIHDCEQSRRWDEQELLLLRTAAELIGGTLQRWHDEDDLRRVEQERLALERRLLETQHAESLGVLAQGVAHDFNNILAAILGHAELALLDIPAGSEAAASLDAIARGARRAAELTGQMLTYAGQGKLVSSAVDLSALARDVGELMRVALPYEIELRYELATLPSVPADETKVRQMLLNLVTNAAESIAASGAITLATGQEELGPAELKAALFSAATPGPACFIEVRDSGGGMDEATLARIFDPFFSTKFTGRGLGLPAVQGIVRAHRGALFVRSAPGAGASFRVYFPLAT